MRLVPSLEKVEILNQDLAVRMGRSVRDTGLPTTNNYAQNFLEELYKINIDRKKTAPSSFCTTITVK
jgi:hypothetical protein